MKPTSLQPYHETSGEKYYEIADPAEKGKKCHNLRLSDPDALKLIYGIYTVVLCTI